MKPKVYLSEVETAIGLLSDVHVRGSATPDQVHPSVRAAHVHLKKACRMYRRYKITRVFFVVLEWHAVGLGMLRSDEVEKL